MTKAIELKRGDSVKVEGRFRKVEKAWLAGEIVSVWFCNGDSIKWSASTLLETK